MFSDTFKAARKSIFLLTATFERVGTKQGTAFAGVAKAKEALFLTALHNIRNDKGFLATDLRLSHEDVNILAEPIQADLVGHDLQTDIAILKVVGYPGNVYPLGLRGSPVEPDEKLRIYSYKPEDTYTLTPHDCKYLGFAWDAQSEMDRLIIATVPEIEPSSSGAPVIDGDGRIVGVVRSLLEKEPRPAVVIPISDSLLLAMVGDVFDIDMSVVRRNVSVKPPHVLYHVSRLERVIRDSAGLPFVNESMLPLLSYFSGLVQKITDEQNDAEVLAQEREIVDELCDVVSEVDVVRIPDILDKRDRLTLSLLERYPFCPAMRRSWEFRTVLGNLLTPSVDSVRSEAALAKFKAASLEAHTWDYAQVIFDAYQNLSKVSEASVHYLLDLIQHENHQVRWNVLHCVKWSTLPTEATKMILSRLVSDPSAWVRKGVLERFCKSDGKTRVVRDILVPLLAANADEFVADRMVLDYYLLAVEGGLAPLWMRRCLDCPTIRSATPLAFDGRWFSSKALALDLRELLMPVVILFQHGRFYSRALNIVSQRLLKASLESRLKVWRDYLLSPIEAFNLAAASVLFGPHLSEYSQVELEGCFVLCLNHRVEWVRRQAVESLLRSRNTSSGYRQRVYEHWTELSRDPEIEQYGTNFKTRG